MEDKSFTHDDPEIAALLDFEPVVRKCRRHDGWSASNQRRYILGLAETGNPEQAAHPLGRTMSGAYKVRTSAGGESFGAAWDAALALHLRRNPRPLPKGRPSRGEILAGSGRAWPAATAPAAPAPEEGDEEKAKDRLEWLEGILERYWLKLKAERRARLAGRIVEADFYVRQLTWIEVCLDLGGRSLELLRAMKRGDHDALRITATPMSLLLDQVRRTFWQEGGEPERPPLGPLGEHDGEVALGEPSYFQPTRDGNLQAWEQRRRERAALAAEAQVAWEEKARAEAEEWARREGPGDPSSRQSRREGEESEANECDADGTEAPR